VYRPVFDRVTELTLNEPLTVPLAPAKFTHALAIPVMPFCVARTPVGVFKVVTVAVGIVAVVIVPVVIVAALKFGVSPDIVNGIMRLLL
jgi:hypothetical protein